MSTKTNYDLVTPKSSSKPVSWVPSKNCETIDSLLSSFVFRPLFESRLRKLSSLFDSRNEKVLESFSPTSDLTCLLKIGNGWKSCTKSNHFWPPPKPPKKWKKFWKNSKSARNNSKRQQNDDRNSKNLKLLWSRRKTISNSQLLLIRMFWLMPMIDALNSSETRSNSKEKLKNLTNDLTTKKNWKS